MTDKMMNPYPNMVYYNPASPVPSYNSATPPVSPISPESATTSASASTRAARTIQSSNSFPPGGGNSCATSPRPWYDDNEEENQSPYGSPSVVSRSCVTSAEDDEHRSHANLYRTGVVNPRALALLDHTVADRSTVIPKLSGALSMRPQAYDKPSKEDLERSRARAANARALALLDSAVNHQHDYDDDDDDNVNNKNEKKDEHPIMRPPAPMPKLSGALSIRQAVQAYDKVSTHPGWTGPARNHLSGAPARRQEEMATTTRRRRAHTVDSMDIDTVATMKCKLDWDREREARSRALALLRNGFMD